MASIKSHIILPLCFCLLTLAAPAQEADTCKVSHNLFHKVGDSLLHGLEVGANVGTTGIGLNLAMPVSDAVRLRMGVDYFPHTNVPMTFNLMSYAGVGDDDTDPETKFDRLAELMKDFTGIEVDRKVKMNAKGTMLDFKFLVDVFPIKNNRHFYATAGFYWGSSKVGHIENNVVDAPSLIGCMMYNRYYDYFMNYTFLDEPLYKDVWFPEDLGHTLREKFERYGRIGAHVGDFKDGQPYMMEPDENGMVRADMYVNHFKPYVGVGYTTELSKDGRWTFSVDAGALFWGRPRIYTHERYYYNVKEDKWMYGYITNPDPDGDGVPDYEIGDKVDLAQDVDHISGKAGTYVDIAKTIRVYPVVNLRIALKLF